MVPMGGREWGAASVAVLVVTLLGGCGPADTELASSSTPTITAASTASVSTSDTRTFTAPSPAATSLATTSPPAATSAAVSASPAASPTSSVSTVPPSVTSTVSAPETEFYSPSGNVACLMSGGASPGVRCEISSHTWTAPPQPSSCRLDWGFAVVLDPRAEFLCASDTIRGSDPVNPAAPPSWFVSAADSYISVNGAPAIALGYGHTLVSGPLRCTSTTAGVSCTNTRTAASLFLSRERYALH